MLRWFMILGLAIVCAFSISARGESRPTLMPPEGEVVYRDYDDPNLMLVAERLYRSHRQAEAVEACTEALGRNLTDIQAASMKHLLAKSYEAIPGHGQDAKDAYLRVIQEHPSYERLPEVAYRLGELNICIIPPGTEPNNAKGSEYLRLVIDRLPVADEGYTAVTYLSLEAHMMLGNLLLVKGQNEEAKTCFKTIYDCDINKVTALPWEQFDNEEERQEHLVWLKERITGMKKRLPRKMVSSCISSDLGLSMQRLAQLQSEYPDDAEIHQIVSEVLRKLSEVEDIINQQISGG